MAGEREVQGVTIECVVAGEREVQGVTIECVVVADGDGGVLFWQ